MPALSRPQAACNQLGKGRFWFTWGVLDPIEADFGYQKSECPLFLPQKRISKDALRFPRVARGQPGGWPRSTRGYRPAPRWGARRRDNNGDRHLLPPAAKGTSPRMPGHPCRPSTRHSSYGHAPRGAKRAGAARNRRPQRLPSAGPNTTTPWNRKERKERKGKACMYNDLRYRPAGNRRRLAGGRLCGRIVSCVDPFIPYRPRSRFGGQGWRGGRKRRTGRDLRRPVNT